MLTQSLQTPGNVLRFPAPTNRGGSAEWDGETFRLANERTRILAYDVSPSGWTDELTTLHEESGGSSHFIDVASRSHAVAEVVRCAGSNEATVLEVGCSSGFLLRDLLAKLPNAKIIGADYTWGTLEALGKRLPGVPLLQFDLTRCPLPDAFADATVLLNVLEHIRDHEAAIRHLFRITRPGGAVIIEVPAGAHLFDVYDRVLMHERRYDMRELVSLVEAAGFVVERKSHLGAFLYPPFYLSKRLNQRRYPPGVEVNERALVAGMIGATGKSSWFMGGLMRMEAAIRQHVHFPVGIRCLLTCRKPNVFSTTASPAIETL
jgi:SAM-dependent methyltransferase